MERLYGRRDFLKVASNESPVGPSPKAVAALRKAIRETHLYPEQSYPKLKDALSRKFRVRPENIFLGDGTSEIIVLTASAFLKPGDEAVTAEPSFVMHDHAINASGAKLVKVPLKNFKLDLPAMARAVNRRTRMIFVCNPNNPTGTIVDRREVADFLRRLPGNLIVVFDEAYAEFCDDRGFPDTLEYVRKGLRVIVMRTFAKISGLAGLRVGYAFAPAEIVGVLDRLRQPFNVNTLAYRAAVAAVADKEWDIRTKKVVREGRNFLFREFSRMGLEPVASHANFVMVMVGDGPAFAEKLIRQGIIVRPLQGSVVRPFVRVTVGTMKENRRVVGAFRRVLYNTEP
jgi:histidinol-phosphate aminotransferase